MLLLSFFSPSQSNSITCPVPVCHWISSCAGRQRLPGVRSGGCFKAWVSLLALGSVTASTEVASSQNPITHSAGPVPSAQFFNLPMQFEPNAGQTDSRVEFVSRGPGYTLFLTSTQAVLSLRSVKNPPAEERSGRRQHRRRVPVAVNGAKVHLY